jgi:hypothetical protein
VTCDQNTRTERRVLQRVLRARTASALAKPRVADGGSIWPGATSASRLIVSEYGSTVARSDYPYEAKRRVEALIETLEPLVKRDPEQEIRGVAVPVFEATLEELRNALPNGPVVQAVVGAYAHEIETREPVRAVDALLVARQIDAAIGPFPITIA